jgi:hypothetical protein
VPLLIVCAFLGTASGTSASVIDQWQIVANADTGFGLTSSVGQQGVTAGLSGRLVGFELWNRGVRPAQVSDVQVFVKIGAPVVEAAPVFEAGVTATSGGEDDWIFIDTSAVPILLTAGQQVTLGVLLNGTFNMGIENPGGYGGGGYYQDGALMPYDATFRTYMQPVPEPVAFVLIASAVGLLAMGNR